nr:deoxynucleoside triphosphate triphosphohydrolase SAMHD1 isoform X2 [Crassostrea gigas]
MPLKENKRKNAGQTGTTQPKRQTTEQEHEPSEAIESSGEQPSPFSEVPGEHGPSQTPDRQSTSNGLQAKKKIFNDPIHGHIEIHPLCVKIIDTPQFQRLRSIKQVGGTYFVYPGASHNRFEHSIGVCHLAGQFVSALRVGQSELNITDDDVLCVQIAGLCHDLGHGPFSHMFDGRFLPSIGNETRHESLSVKMFHHLVKENELDTDFRLHFKEDLNTNKKFITELIDTKDENRGWPYEGRDKKKRFLYEIVANKRNGIDVDKWDYFARDCHMLGIANSFDHTRCMKSARVVEVDGEKQICFRDKEVQNLYEMFHTRVRLYREAYEHCVGNTIEIMISEAMKMADKFIKIPGKNNEMLSISGTLEDMEAYEKLTDSIVDQIMWSTDKNLEKAKNILINVKKRKLYVCLGHALLPNTYTKTKEEAMQIYVEILKANGSTLCKDDVTIDLVKLNYGKKDQNPIDHVRFYKKDDQDRATKIDIEEVSFLLPKNFAEQQFRFYCKTTDADQKAREALEDWCKKKGCSLIKGS